jgi:anti-sigma factor RsiW
MQPEDPALAIAARHALHDEELIAAFATNGDAADDASRARSLIERCQACSALHADLVAIGGALRATPKAAAVAAVQPAPRDFRLSVQTANRLRPGSVVLRLRDRIREAIASFSRPLGMSMASVGVVGLLLGTLTLGGTASSGGAQQDASNIGADGSSSAPAGSAEGMGATAAPGGLTGAGGTPRETSRMSFDTRSAGPSAPVAGDTTHGPIAGSRPTMPVLIVVGSIGLLVAGLALVLLGGRRREPIPSR